VGKGGIAFNDRRETPMPIKIMNAKQFVSGLIFFAIGLAIMVEGRHYDIGTATQMGPGYFPMLLGGILTILGATAMVTGIRSTVAVPIGPWPVVPLFFVSLAVAAFALLINSWGLLAAVFALIALSCYGRLRRNPLEALVIFATLSGVTYGIFVYVLQLPIELI
jgi:hypothetical protein